MFGKDIIYQPLYVFLSNLLTWLNLAKSLPTPSIGSSCLESSWIYSYHSCFTPLARLTLSNVKKTLWQWWMFLNDTYIVKRYQKNKESIFLNVSLKEVACFKVSWKLQSNIWAFCIQEPFMIVHVVPMKACLLTIEKVCS